MKYLVTGGAGFIGSHLVEFLLTRGHSVIALDDLSTGSLENLKAIQRNPSFELVIDTVLNKPILERLSAKSEGVFHLAAAVGVRTVIEHPLSSLRTNVEGTTNVLESSVVFGRKVLLTSTSEVYGKNEDAPFKEEDNLIIGPTFIRRWGYACSKALDEFLAQAYFLEKKVPIIIARLFNTIGPRQTGRYGMVVPKFISQALSGKPITIYGDGKQSRCFTYVSDVVEALYLLFRKEGLAGGVFNIGTREEVTINELARKIKRFCHSDSPIIHIAPDKVYQEGFEDMRRRVPDLSRIEEAIGYRPKVKLNEALKRIIASYPHPNPPHRGRGPQCQIGGGVGGGAF